MAKKPDEPVEPVEPTPEPDEPVEDENIPELDRNVETSLDDTVDEVDPPDLDELADFLDVVALENDIKRRKNEARDGRSDEEVPDDSTDAEVS